MSLIKSILVFCSLALCSCEYFAGEQRAEDSIVIIVEKYHESLQCDVTILVDGKYISLIHGPDNDCPFYILTKPKGATNIGE
jgi:hypothetical protein